MTNTTQQMDGARMSKRTYQKVWYWTILSNVLSTMDVLTIVLALRRAPQFASI